MQQWKLSVTNYHENWRRGNQQARKQWFPEEIERKIDGEKLITDAHEISVQSAVMSGLKYANSSQLNVALTRGRYHEHLCVQVHNSLYQGKLFEDDQAFTKNIDIKELLYK